MDDMVVPQSMSDFVQRILPDAMVHKLLYEGHFTYFYFCDECHRQILSTAYGTPQGPLVPVPQAEQPSNPKEVDEEAEVILDGIPIDEESVPGHDNSNLEDHKFSQVPTDGTTE